MSSWSSSGTARGWTAAPVPPDALAFHRALPGYAPTPLIDVPALAAELGVARVLVKDESQRLGLPAFKVLGASWACRQVLARTPGAHLVAATDDNHGRAVARMAAHLGVGATVLVPAVMLAETAERIAGEGATVVRVDGDDDETVRQAAAHAAAGPGRVLVQDTAWEGYTQVPARIVAASVVVELRRMCDSGDFGQLRATVGTFDIGAGQTNVIPHRAMLTIDLRNPVDEKMTAAEQHLAEHVAALASRHGVQVAWERMARTAVVPFHPDVQELLAQTADALALPYVPRHERSGPRRPGDRRDLPHRHGLRRRRARRHQPYPARVLLPRRAAAMAPTSSPTPSCGSPTSRRPPGRRPLLAGRGVVRHDDLLRRPSTGNEVATEPPALAQRGTADRA